METVLKQRLIGAVVLVALAVIFVPMILDGPGRKDQSVLEIEIPVAPKFSFESNLPDPGSLDTLPESEKSKNPEASQKPSKASPEEVQVSKAETPVPEVVESAADHIEPSPSLGAWVVQVAAFSEQGKALTLQGKLSAGDYPVFTEKFEKEGKMLYRVKAGPELKRENADKLRTRIEKDHGIKGAFVVEHP